MNAKIQCKHISKHYPNPLTFKKGTKVLDDISFHVESGEVFGIIGLNGAGKSTTLKILLGFVRTDSGEVTLNQLPAHNSACREFVGFLPENPCLYGNLSLTDHLRFALASSGKGNISPNAISAILEQVQLTEHAHQPIRNLSKGMTQRATLAFALIRKPEILILDEPMSGLDPKGRQLVTDIIEHYHQQGTTVLFCSHILTDVERVCDRIAIMHKGRLLDITTPQDVQAATQAAAPTTMKPLEHYFLTMVEES